MSCLPKPPRNATTEIEALTVGVPETLYSLIKPPSRALRQVPFV
jgi:hypothetical protein